MGRNALVHSKAPIAQLLLQYYEPTETELKNIATLCASDETGALENLFLTNTQPSHLLVTTFNQCNADQKRECILAARTYLGDYIARLDEGLTLNFLANFLLDNFSKTQPAQHLKLAQNYGKTAILRAAMVNPVMATFAFDLLINSLPLDRKKWLSLSLNLEQMIKQTTLNNKLITGPSMLDEDNEYIGNLLMLYYHWPMLRQDFKTRLEAAIVTSDPQKGEALTQIQEAVDKLIENEVTQFSALINTYNPIKTAKTLSISHDIAQLSAEQIAWLSLNAYLPEPQAFGSISKDTPLNSVLTILIKKYGREALISVLQEKNTKAVNQEVHLQVERFYDDIVISMSFNTRRWLFLNLLLEDQTNFYAADITAPTEEDALTCQQLTQFAYQCHTITKLLHRRLNARLPGEGDQLFNTISNYIRFSIRSLNDQMRLWQYLSLATHSEPQYFSYLGTGAHESNLGNVVYRTSFTSLSAHLQRMAGYSNYLRNTINNALLENVNQSLEFEKTLTRLHLYKSRTLRMLLANCEPNTLNWLYFSLLINSHQKESMQLKGKLNIIVPKERQWTHAQQILDLVTATDDAKSILKEIESIAKGEHVEHLRQIRNFNNIYIRAKIKKLSAEAKNWLYYALKTWRVEINIKVSAHQVINLPEEDRNDMAKICYALANQIELIPVIKDYLCEEYPQVTELQPENDIFSFFACVQSAPGEFSYYESLSQSMSLQIMPMLMKSTAKATKAWLREALTSGFIDSRQLIESLPKEMSAQLNHELALVPNILVLALKWPSVRKFIVQECGGDIVDAKPITGVIIDKLHFSEKGMMALALSLKTHRDKLTHFSAIATHLSDDGLVMLADTLIGRAPLKLLQLHQNPNLSSEALSQLIRFANERLSVEQQPFISTTLIGCLIDPDVFSWLSTRLSFADTSLVPFLAQASFFVSPNSQEKMKLAQLIYEDALHKPILKAAIIHITQLMAPQVILNNQLMYAVVNSQNADLIFTTLTSLVKANKNVKVTNWLREALSKGILKLSGQDYYNEQEQMQIIQLCCLLLVTTRAQRFALGKQLNCDEINIFSDLKTFNLEGISLSPLLQSALIAAIHYNNDSLSSLSIKASSLYNIDALCLALASKRNFKHLNLSANPIQVSGACSIGTLLAQNKHIEALDLNDCLCGEDGAIALLEQLPHSALKRLSLQNSGENWPTFSPIRQKGARAIALALSAPQCALTELDLSHNHLNHLGMKYIVESIKKNQNLPLTSLKLNYNDLGDASLTQVCTILDKPSLSSIELDGHHAQPATLEIIAEKLSTNTHICHFEALPNYELTPLFSEDQAPMEENLSKAKNILKRIQENILHNKTQNKLVKKFRKMKLSSSLSIENEDRDFSFKRSASSPNFDSDSEVLTFSKIRKERKLEGAKQDRPSTKLKYM